MNGNFDQDGGGVCFPLLTPLLRIETLSVNLNWRDGSFTARPTGFQCLPFYTMLILALSLGPAETWSLFILFSPGVHYPSFTHLPHRPVINLLFTSLYFISHKARRHLAFSVTVRENRRSVYIPPTATLFFGPPEGTRPVKHLPGTGVLLPMFVRGAYMQVLPLFWGSQPNLTPHHLSLI